MYQRVLLTEADAADTVVTEQLFVLLKCVTVLLLDFTHHTLSPLFVIFAFTRAPKR